MVRATTLAAEAAAAVVVKHATGADAATLAAEGARLQTAAHPGVVEVLSSTGSDEAWELCLAHAGRPVEVLAPLPADQVAAIAAAVAATLADLHDAGIVHGRIDASHVLLGPHGRPVLCGFAPPDEVMTPAGDVAALGALMVELLDGPDDGEPIPDRRWTRRRSWSGWSRRSLLTIADQACAEPPTRRPSARRLAAAIAEAVPTAALAGGVTADPAPPGEASEQGDASSWLDARRAAWARDGVGRSRSLAPVAVGFAAVVILAALLRLGAADAGGTEPERRPASVGEVVLSPPPSVEPLPTTAAGAPPVPCVPPPNAAAAPEDCADPVEVDGTTVLVGDRRYTVGQPGDVVVLGDWDCDGVATPAALRPRSGEVFVFPTWATTADLVVRAVDVVEDGVTLGVEADPEAPDCAVLVVRRAEGSSVPVPVAPAP